MDEYGECLSDDIIEALKLDGRWPTEEMIQQACLADCIVVKYDSYDEWWDSNSSGVSRLIRKLIVEDLIGHDITWDDYERYVQG